MPYAYVEPDLYLRYNGVDVFPLYDGCYDALTYWFTTDPETADDFFGHGRRGQFDARILAGRWETTPCVQEWNDFWKPRFRTEDEAIDALIKGAIDDGRIRSFSSAEHTK